MSFRKISLMLPAFLLVMISSGQSVKSLPEDPARFPVELESVFSSVTSPSAGIQIRDMLIPFLEYWNAGLFSEKEQKNIIRQSNIVMGKRLVVFPNLYRYISAVYHLKRFGNEGALTIWMEDFDKQIPESSQGRSEKYLEQYEALFARNRLYESGTYNWYTSDTSIRMEYDTAMKIIYRDVLLTCATRKDTSRIYNTSGIFYPGTLEWKGMKGRVTWERVGLDPDSVYADFQDYRINMKKFEYRVDSAGFMNKKYFTRPILGVFKDETLTSPPGPNSTHPQFEAYLNTLEIKDLFRNIDYLGGFTQQGLRITGSGAGDGNASLSLKRGPKEIARIRAKAFRLHQNQVTANPASITIPLDEDSIYHAGLQMKYFVDSAQLLLYQEKDATNRSPFFNSYHDLDMDCGSMEWKIDSNFIDFSTFQVMNDTNLNSFYSGNYYSPAEFYKQQGLDDTNPLYVVKDFCETYGTREIKPDILAHFMKKPVEQVKAMLFNFSSQGFVAYDFVNDKAIVKDKLYHYLDAKAGKIDYDVIGIHSKAVNESNARLNLETKDLDIRGVPMVQLSQAHRVYIFPDSNEIKVKKGLDFVFSGRVQAGPFLFFAHESSFEYDTFKLNMPFIDLIKFRVDDFGKEGGQVTVQSPIADASGKLYIDAPRNKSGKTTIPDFPLFKGEKESYVYYDQDRHYDKEKFAYNVKPFNLAGLDKLQTDDIKFDGYLNTGGIFPDIDQALVVQEDYSLGFKHITPREGYEAYGGKAVFYDTIDLSNKGLRGHGRLEYLTSVTHSEDFLFYPDSMVTSIAEKFNIESQVARVEYPDVAAEEIRQVWFPAKDTMRLLTLKKPFRMFGEKSEMYGDLYYSPDGLTGSGKVNFESVELASSNYRFQHHTIDADTLDFKLFTKGTQDLAVAARKYRTHVDFEQREVEFRTNQKGSYVSFPYNNFACYMDNIDWAMDKNEMRLYNDLGTRFANIDNLTRQELLRLDMSGSDLVATNPQADSLSFFSVTARYDLQTYEIDAENVKLIRVADAAIFPDSSFVKISRGGKINTLKNAAVIADTARQYHTIERADIDITSRFRMSGKGFYQYKSGAEAVQEVPLISISVDSARHTVATGSIPESLKFMLNPHFAFRGKMDMNSSRKELEFDGGFKTQDECYPGMLKYWVAFDAWINPDSVRIPVQPPVRDMEGRRVDLALQMSDSEDDIYSSWFTLKKYPKDSAIVAPAGEIYFDEWRGSYRIDQSKDKKLPGFEFNPRSCSFITAGEHNLGLKLDYVSLVSYGDVNYMTVPDSTIANLTLSVNFMFYDGSLTIMADSILKSNLKGLDVTRKSYLDFLDFTLGSESGDYKKDMAGIGRNKRLPDVLNRTMILTDVNLYWNSFTNSYISRGPIGVMSLGRDPVNRYMNGFVELMRRRSGDGLFVYLEIDENRYYFFEYRNGILQALSHDKEFVNRINEVKPEKRSMVLPGADQKYEYMVGDKRRMIDFIRKMQSLSY